MLGTVLKQYNGTPTPRIRPQSLAACQHSLQSCISLGNTTIFSGKIQTSAYDSKGCHKNSSEEIGKKKSKENLHRNISQADSTMPRIKDLHSSLWQIFAVKLETFSSREDICFR
jgi:hypothetical protein